MVCTHMEYYAALKKNEEDPKNWDGVFPRRYWMHKAKHQKPCITCYLLYKKKKKIIYNILKCACLYKKH